jgi:hypothetical protein
MERGFVTLAAALALAGCANVVDTGPSFLGMTTESETSGVSDTRGAPPQAVQHVTSNRVLGAMAFQKVTGAKVDPTRLVGEGD